MLLDLARQSFAALRLLVVFTVILGLGYPLAVWAAGQALGDRAAGQPVRIGDRIVGSALIGQDFRGEQWFHSRPSANDYDTLASAPSNLGPTNPDLVALIDERRAAVARSESVTESEVPPDAVTASGSGLDPHISPEYARLQASRVARSNGLSRQEVAELIEANTEGRVFGFLGEPAVNVLRLNSAVREAVLEQSG